MIAHFAKSKSNFLPISLILCLIPIKFETLKPLSGQQFQVGWTRGRARPFLYLIIPIGKKSTNAYSIPAAGGVLDVPYSQLTPLNGVAVQARQFTYAAHPM